MEEIIISDSLISGNRLTSTVTFPKRLMKYFKSFSFFAEYDTKIRADKSILNIPLLSAVLPLAWLTGHNIYVNELDSTFGESMEELKKEFMKIYPEIPFTTKINTDILVENSIGEIETSKRTALLFSGGVDSTYSLITNMELEPRLIMIWGIEGYPYPLHAQHWDWMMSTYSRFAGRRGLSINFVKTNATSVLDDRRIEHDFHRLLYDGTIRARLQHSLVLLPLAAPLSTGRFDRILMAASQDPTYPQHMRPWGGTPDADEKIIWADLKVKHHGYIHRTQKITGAMKKHLENDKLTLQVCFRPRRNCCSCEKCYRTIATLVLAGIDPRDCGFDIEDNVFDGMKSFFENTNMPYAGTDYRWTPIKNIIPDNIDYDICGSKNFFKWFRNFDLKTTEKNIGVYRKIYLTLPYNIAKILDIFYRKVGINMHEHSPTLPDK